MSPIGRIFIVLNLVLAVVFLGWASSNLVNSQNWKADHEAEVVAHAATKADLDGQIDELLHVLAERRVVEAPVRVVVRGVARARRLGCLELGHESCSWYNTLYSTENLHLRAAAGSKVYVADDTEAANDVEIATGGGNVGIGQKNPTSRLHVGGNIAVIEPNDVR